MSKPKTMVEQFVSTRDGLRSFQQEAAILSLTEHVCAALEELSMTRDGLAELLGVGKEWVDEFLDGDGNKEIRDIANVFTALGLEVSFVSSPIRFPTPVD